MLIRILMMNLFERIVTVDLFKTVHQLIQIDFCFTLADLGPAFTDCHDRFSKCMAAMNYMVQINRSAILVTSEFTDFHFLQIVDLDLPTHLNCRFPALRLSPWICLMQPFGTIEDTLLFCHKSI